MKIRTILFAAAVGLVAAASAQSFSPERKFVQDEKDTYSMKVNATTQMGDVTINMDMSQKVTKVYENGDADVESSIDNMVVNIGGQEMTPPSSNNKSTYKVNKYGMRLDVPAKGRQASMNFAQFGAFLGDKELKVGDTYSFDNPEKDNPKNHSKGTVKLLSIDGGKAKLSVTLDRYTEGAEKPMHVDGSITVDATTKKMLHFEGKATNLPAAQGQTVSEATFTLDHK